MGWRGVYVEPVREFADQCRARHRRNSVTVYECAAGSSNSTTEIVVQGEYTRGVDAALVESLAQGNRRKVPVRTLDGLLREAGAPGKFELLIIDTEGAELEVLRGLDLGAWSPRAIMVETNFVNREMDEAVRAHLEQSGYVLIYRDMVNSILVDADRLDEVRGRSA
jgi:FkbM family methyltransferase